MYQSFASPAATQGPGNSGDIDCFVCNARSYALHRGGNFQVKSPQIVSVFSPLLPRLYLLGNQRPRTTTALLG